MFYYFDSNGFIASYNENSIASSCDSFLVYDRKIIIR